MDYEIQTCARPGCENEMPPRAASGRRRLYCSDACKVAHYRERQRTPIEKLEPIATPAVELPPDAVGAYLEGRRGDPDDQVVAAIVEAQALMFTLRRLGRDARAPFRWRCAGLGDTIADGLRRYFGKAVE